MRGIVEGNGTPPGKDIGLTYSVKKEDLWVARICQDVETFLYATHKNWIRIALIERLGHTLPSFN